jgi:hypothetical protein
MSRPSPTAGPSRSGWVSVAHSDEEADRYVDLFEEFVTEVT